MGRLPQLPFLPECVSSRTPSGVGDARIGPGPSSIVKHPAWAADRGRNGKFVWGSLRVQVVGEVWLACVGRKHFTTERGLLHVLSWTDQNAIKRRLKAKAFLVDYGRARASRWYWDFCFSFDCARKRARRTTHHDCDTRSSSPFPPGIVNSILTHNTTQHT